MTDLNVDSFRSVSPVNRERMQKDREKTSLAPCFGFTPDSPPRMAFAQQEPNVEYWQKRGAT